MAVFNPKGKTSAVITKADAVGNEGKLRMIDISLLENHPCQKSIYGDSNCLDEIKESIKKHGFRGNPVIVSHRDNHYTIISGHTRTQAARELGYKEIQCQIFEKFTELDENELLVDYNVQRGHRDLNPAVKARELVFLYENHLKRAELEHTKPMSMRELGTKYFKYSNSVYQRIKEIVNSDEGIKALLDANVITARSMDDIANLTIDEQKALAEAINEKVGDTKTIATVNDVKKIIDDIKSTNDKKSDKKQPEKDKKPVIENKETSKVIIKVNSEIYNKLYKEFGDKVDLALSQYLNNNIDKIIKELDIK